MPLRIGLDTRAAFLDPHRGLGRVTRSLTEALLGLAGTEPVLFVPHGAVVPPRWYTEAAAVVALRRPRRGAFLVDPPAWAWTLRRYPLDVLWLPAWGVPPAVPCPVVATFHDATPLRFPSPPGRWPRHRARTGIRSLRRATLIHAVSDYAAGEARHCVGLPAERIRTVHWGVGAPFTPDGTAAAGRYLLFVGGADPHKNLDLLLAVLRDGDAAAVPPLVIAGPSGAASAADQRLADLAASGRVRLEPGVSDERLAALYRGAVALLLPSRNEGFGLPALEAMACGCPVLAARAGALPEVCGDAAVLLPVDDPRAWLAAMMRLVADRESFAERRAAGLARAAALSWAACANGMTALFAEAKRV